MSDPVILSVLLLSGFIISLIFITGFFTGLWLARHNTREIVEKLPPEIVRVPELYIQEAKPIEAPKPVKRPDPGPFIMRPDQRSVLERQEADRMGELLEDAEL